MLLARDSATQQFLQHYLPPNPKRTRKNGLRCHRRNFELIRRQQLQKLEQSSIFHRFATLHLKSKLSLKMRHAKPFGG
jgi:hypothetical protein